MIDITFSALLGYLLGSLNPASWIAMLKKKNLRESGTRNLGATNTAMAFGTIYGVAVMLFDILKAYIAVKLANRLFGLVPAAGLTAGCFAIVGHIFPFYLKFKGGKGLAAFGGLILAVDYVTFFILVVIGVTLMLVTKYGVALPFSAMALAPIVSGLRTQSLLVFGMMLMASGLIFYKHKENIEKLKNGSEMKLGDYSATRSQNKSSEKGA